MKTPHNTHVLVLSSDIDNEQKASLACRELSKMEGVHATSVDLEDREKVLRLECLTKVKPRDIENKMAEIGFQCSEMAD